MDSDTELRKKELRSKMLNMRRGTSPEKLAGFSLNLQRRLMKENIWQQAASVALYIATQNEADTALLLEQAWNEGKTVYLPRVVKEEAGKMHFARCSGFFELERGTYGIMEPAPGSCPPCEFTLALEETASRAAAGSVANSIIAHPPDLFIIPGVAFDRKGNRLGFGGGYYDRFLSGAACREHSFFVALAYDFQIVESVPAGEWDQPVQAICTEKEFWLTGG